MRHLYAILSEMLSHFSEHLGKHAWYRDPKTICPPQHRILLSLDTSQLLTNFPKALPSGSGDPFLLPGFVRLGSSQERHSTSATRLALQRESFQETLLKIIGLASALPVCEICNQQHSWAGGQELIFPSL